MTTGEFESWAHNVDPTELGRLFKEYIAESNYNGWDGFKRHDMTGIRHFLADMQLYYTHAEPGTFKTTSSVNPT